MPGRSFNSDSYKYGFNGMEKDDEISGTGNSYTAEFWQYDSRLGRRWNIDPVVKPNLSNYQTFSNNPIIFIDPLGDDDYYNRKGKYLGSIGEDNGVMRVISSNEVFSKLQESRIQGGKVIIVDQMQIAQELSSLATKTFNHGKEYVVNIIFDPDKALIYAEYDSGADASDNEPYKSYPITKTTKDGTGFDDINSPLVLIGAAHGHPKIEEGGRINISNVSGKDMETSENDGVAGFAIDAFKSEHVNYYKGKGQIHKADLEGKPHPNQGTLDDLRTGQYDIGKDAMETTGGK
jgi:RHS repeat-associated protein